MKTQHPLCEILFAMATGNTVQMCVKPGPDGWFDWVLDCTNPLDSDADEFLWRIKPEPKPDVVRYLNAAPYIGNLVKRVDDNTKLIFDGETGKLKSAEVL